ncbi:MAG: MATE family efflux transporter [Clostridia bacterium]|nr:MATE family efflux transporter [Clostridia bacterium]
MADRKNDLTQGSVTGKLLSFFFPIWIGLLFQQLYNTADAFIVGRFVGDNALAAVGGSASSIINLVIGFFNGLNSGATVLIAQKYGARDYAALRRVLNTAVVFSIGVGLLITAAGDLTAPAFLRFLQNPEDIMDDSVMYLRIYLTGAVLLLLYNLFQGTMQATGDSARPLLYLVCSCCVNILLDLLFVAKFGWGIAGAGWASVISMAVCTVMAGVHLLRTKEHCRLVPKELRLNVTDLKNIMRIGLPAGIQGSMYSVSNMIIQSTVNTFGTGLVTAWTATGKLDGFYWSTSSAVGTSLCAFVGQCYGAGKTDRMRAAIRTCLRLFTAATVVMSAGLLAVARPAYSLFLNDPQVIDDAIRIMWMFVPCYFIWSFVETLSATFRGVGNTLKPMIIVMLGTCLFRILWMIFIVPLKHTIDTVSIVYGISWLITAAAMIIYYKRGKWLTNP